MSRPKASVREKASGTCIEIDYGKGKVMEFRLAGEQIEVSVSKKHAVAFRFNTQDTATLQVVRFTGGS